MFTIELSALTKDRVILEKIIAPILNIFYGIFLYDRFKYFDSSALQTLLSFFSLAFTNSHSYTVISSHSTDPYFEVTIFFLTTIYFSLSSSILTTFS